MSKRKSPPPTESGGCWLAGITLGEIRRGIELHRLKDPVAAGSLERWLSGLETHYAEHVLPVAAAIADRWRHLSPHQPRPVSDGLIAATAIEHRLSVVTRNVDDFRRSGVNTLNPFQ
ncbi:putative nucleic acid-binding protein [Opitutaceae bacterium TAV1]|nr:putative nucleic acid-binding protein [Opitutaceae bacterium TAV1]